ncbi:predicted protein [Histoplasma capsulatum G186AR]|uniref:Uncharacterized protein n=1 Tax=Ajellomyces capsulatus (strain G186AR / H82 / ATCC MYA-2454 / RMSCC 2432) TaxID=447093 RepID=C0NMB7_AJECG|nr:uncharacterized protein HCBG_04647 [Histoplasma capsulatum G186AR]EEH07768.1 predicted protein [Histoplasma capsulatum G186AR]
MQARAIPHIPPPKKRRRGIGVDKTHVVLLFGIHLSSYRYATLEKFNKWASNTEESKKRSWTMGHFCLDSAAGSLTCWRWLSSEPNAAVAAASQPQPSPLSSPVLLVLVSSREVRSISHSIFYPDALAPRSLLPVVFCIFSIASWLCVLPRIKCTGDTFSSTISSPLPQRLCLSVCNNRPWFLSSHWHESVEAYRCVAFLARGYLILDLLSLDDSPFSGFSKYIIIYFSS